MATKLYDLYRQPSNETEVRQVTFLMRAPLATISEFLSLRIEAERRIWQELSTGPTCQLHNSRLFPGVVHVVTESIGLR